MMKTEKRKANVGERILIKEAEWGQGEYKNGSIATVSEKKANIDSLIYVNEWERSVHESEYEVIAPTKPKKSARITTLETQVATLQAKVEALESAGKYPLTERFERESTSMDAILADIERKAKPTQTPNEQRADVIKRAKAFVGEGFDRWYGNKLHVVEYVVNSDKRTVVALLRWKPDNSVVYKGIAKCDPDDVFNADIGKAIALARALGVEVPTEFVKAVQPTEVVVGQIVYDNDVENDSIGSGIVTAVKPEGFMNADEGYTLDGGWAYLEFARITDDTDAVYE